MKINWKLWKEACEAWKKVSAQVGFESREIAFIQGYYMGAMNRKDKDE